MSPDQLRELLLSNSAVGAAPDIGLADQFVLDSLALTWVQYQVQESFGLEPDPDDERISALTTIERMAEYLNQLPPPGGRT